MSRRRSKPLTFFLSLCTGVGHLYLGAMNRGIQFLIAFLGTISLAEHFHMGFLSFLIPVIWFYGLFDAMQLASQEEIVDKPLVRWERLKGPWAGYALIGIGLVFLANEIIPTLWRNYFQSFLGGWRSVQTLFIAIVLVAAGILLLRGKKVNENDR